MNLFFFTNTQLFNTYENSGVFFFYQHTSSWYWKSKFSSFILKFSLFQELCYLFEKDNEIEPSQLHNPYYAIVLIPCAYRLKYCFKFFYRVEVSLRSALWWQMPFLWNVSMFFFLFFSTYFCSMLSPSCRIASDYLQFLVSLLPAVHRKLVFHEQDYADYKNERDFMW